MHHRMVLVRKPHDSSNTYIVEYSKLRSMRMFSLGNCFANNVFIMILENIQSVFFSY